MKALLLLLLLLLLPAATAELQLQQVQMVFRHGDRSVRALPPGTTPSANRWPRGHSGWHIWITPAAFRSNSGRAVSVRPPSFQLGANPTALAAVAATVADAVVAGAKGPVDRNGQEFREGLVGG